MRKGKFIIGLLSLLIVSIGGYVIYGNTEADIQAIYPRSPESFVGDPMPYYNDDEFRMYYLEDLRDGQIGFHPFSLLETTDFYNYRDHGEVIPFVNEEESAERALGTGSIIQDEDGMYHAFYTGHNQQRTPKEVIMHATSEDGINFDKIPENTFEGDDMYEKDDFRDPYVFWEEESQSYWMLITTRKDGAGVIAKYTSTDLNTWENEGVFFENDLGNDSNLECPSLVQYEDKWYLAFSDQWDQRVVHYRVADEVNGSFEAPKEGLDYVDGAGFYAGRLETDGQHLYLVGWIPTKEEHDDIFNYNWAGNLAVHQLHAEEEQLIPSVPQAAYENVDKIPFSNTTLSAAENITFDSENSTIFEGYIEMESLNTTLVLQFNQNNHILFDFNEQSLAYFNTDLETSEQRESITEIPLRTNNDKVELRIVKENNIVVIYIEDIAFSNRIYDSEGQPFELQVIEGHIRLSAE